MTSARYRPMWLLAALLVAGPEAEARPARTLDDYRHFRALSIDLLGRAPRRDEIAAFERPDFKLDAWIDKLLEGPGYVDRLVRVYMDLLRLGGGAPLPHAPTGPPLPRPPIPGARGEGG